MIRPPRRQYLLQSKCIQNRKCDFSSAYASATYHFNALKCLHFLRGLTLNRNLNLPAPVFSARFWLPASPYPRVSLSTTFIPASLRLCVSASNRCGNLIARYCTARDKMRQFPKRENLPPCASGTYATSVAPRLIFPSFVPFVAFCKTFRPLRLCVKPGTRTNPDDFHSRPESDHVVAGTYDNGLFGRPDANFRKKSEFSGIRWAAAHRDCSLT